MEEIEISKFVVDLNDFKVIQKDKWNGSCGFVSIIENQKTHIQYAAKVLKTPNVDKASDQKHFFKRLKMSIILSGHPVFPFFYGFNLNHFGKKTKSINPTLIYQLIPNGTLYNQLNQSNQFLQNTLLTNTKKQILILGLAIAINYMHHNHICHLDLKPDNILFDQQFYPVICDLGSARFLNVNENDEVINFVSSDVSAPLYTAPEILSMQKFDEKSDVYSFAYLLYFIISGVQPKIEAPTLNDLYQKLISGERPDLSCIYNIQETLDNYPIEFGVDQLHKSLLSLNHKDTPKGFVQLISQCWNGDPQKRPTFSEIINRILYQRDLLLNNVDIKAVNEYLQKFDTIINIAGFDDSFAGKKRLFCRDDEAAILTFEQAQPILINNQKDKIIHCHYRTNYGDHRFQFHQEITCRPNKSDIPNYSTLNDLCKATIDHALNNLDIEAFASIAYNLAFGYNGFPKSATEAIKYSLFAINNEETNSMVTLASLILNFNFSSVDLFLDLVLKNYPDARYYDASKEMQIIAKTLLKTSSQLGNTSAMLAYAFILFLDGWTQRNEKQLKSNSLQKQALSYLKLASEAGNLFAKKIYFVISQIHDKNNGVLSDKIILAKSVFPPPVHTSDLFKSVNS